MALPRLRHSFLTKVKIREKALLRRHSPETKAKIAAARKGKKHSEDTKEKIAESKKDTQANKLRRQKKYRDKTVKDRALCKRQMLRDLAKARELGDNELIQDIVKCSGVRCFRKIHHPEVSDGWSSKGIHWLDPFRIDQRLKWGYPVSKRAMYKWKARNKENKNGR